MKTERPWGMVQARAESNYQTRLDRYADRASKKMTGGWVAWAPRFPQPDIKRLKAEAKRGREIFEASGIKVKPVGQSGYWP